MLDATRTTHPMRPTNEAQAATLRSVAFHGVVAVGSLKRTLIAMIK